MDDDDDDEDDGNDDLTDEQYEFRGFANRLNQLIVLTKRRRFDLDLVDAPRESIVAKIAAELSAESEVGGLIRMSGVS